GRARIAAHLLEADVKPKPQGIGTALRSLGEVLSDADGVVRFDEGAYAEFDLAPYKARYLEDRAAAVDELAAHLDGEDFFIEETVVPENAEVTVFGQYRAADRSIDVGSGLKNVERGLSLGPPAATTSVELRRSAIALVVFLAAAVAFHRWIVPPLEASRAPQRYHGRGVHFETVALLLARGAKPEAVDDWGNTPLARAAVYGHLEIGRALLAAGADANHRAKDGSTALDEARANGHDDFVELLRTVGKARE